MPSTVERDFSTWARKHLLVARAVVEERRKKCVECPETW